jgi:D-lactate dehydrogenase (quinone)
VIGSSCIGASVLGGVCNNSGGALVRRGPAYTELALYAQVGEDGVLRLVNHLGIALGDTPEEVLTRLQAGRYSAADIVNDPARAASDQTYAAHVRDVDAATPARFNADPARLHEASGSAGKLALFAVRLDTFPREDTVVFYIGSNAPDDLTAVRRQLLTALPSLPVAGEYIHRDAYDIGERYGKDTFLLIDRFGTACVPRAFAMKLLPGHLPRRMGDFRARFAHHLLLRVAVDSAQATRDFLQQHFAARDGDWFQCDVEEGRKAFLHRFAIAGAAIRYREVHRATVQDIVALDIALRRDDRDWEESLPAELDRQIVAKLYYGHFFCHVFHQDYIVRKASDPLAIEHAMWKLLDARGAEYPAEHNVGHLYHAKPALAGFYRQLDPTNRFNPGIGHTPKGRHWSERGSEASAASG